MEGWKERVWLYWPGGRFNSIHRRYPTTAWHGDFCLLPLGPGPVWLSLFNLDFPNSFGNPILMPDLVWAPTWMMNSQESRSQAIHRSKPCKQLQLLTRATMPGEWLQSANSSFIGILTVWARFLLFSPSNFARQILLFLLLFQISALAVFLLYRKSQMQSYAIHLRTNDLWIKATHLYR